MNNKAMLIYFLCVCLLFLIVFAGKMMITKQKGIKNSIEAIQEWEDLPTKPGIYSMKVSDEIFILQVEETEKLITYTITSPCE